MTDWQTTTVRTVLPRSDLHISTWIVSTSWIEEHVSWSAFLSSRKDDQGLQKPTIQQHLPNTRFTDPYLDNDSYSNYSNANKLTTDQILSYTGIGSSHVKLKYAVCVHCQSVSHNNLCLPVTYSLEVWKSDLKMYLAACIWQNFNALSSSCRINGTVRHQQHLAAMTGSQLPHQT